MSDDHELTDLEKLRIGGYMAPALRSGASNPKRAVKVVAKDGSMREATLGEVQKGLLLAHEIAFDVAERTPETTYACIVCNREFTWKKAGQVPKSCEDCRRDIRCACGAELRPNSMSPGAIAKRNGAPPRCGPCVLKENWLQRSSRKKLMYCACGKEITSTARCPSRVAARGGAPPQCKACYLARGHQPKP